LGCTTFERKSVDTGGLYKISKETDNMGLRDELISGWECSEYEYTCHECGYVLEDTDLST